MPDSRNDTLRLWAWTIAAVGVVLALFLVAGEHIAHGVAPGWPDSVGWFVLAIAVTLGWGALVSAPIGLAALGRAASPAAFAIGAGIAVAVFAGWWLVRQGAFQVDRGWLRPAVVAAEVVLAAGIFARCLGWFLAWRTRRGGRWSGAAVVIVAACASAAGVGLISLRSGAPVAGSALAADARPSRRLVFWVVDGVSRNHLTYWTALNAGKALSRVAMGGSSAYLTWAPAQAAASWRAALTGADLPGEASPRAGSGQDRALPGGPGWPRFETVTRAAYGAGTARRTAESPSAWEVAARAGLRVDALGWWVAVSGRGVGARVLEDGGYAWMRTRLEGEPTSEVLGPPIPRGILTAARDWARLPWEDWRAGAAMTTAEERAARSAAELPVDLQGLWRDRFFLRAAGDLLSGTDWDLQTVYLDYPLALAAAGNPPTPTAAEAVDEAMRAYLDLLNEHVETALRRLRAGEVFGLLFTPPPVSIGRSLEEQAPAVLMLFGEKIAPASAEGETVQAADVAPTLLYLAGVKLSRESAGAVAWQLLMPGIEDRFPPGWVDAYGRNPPLAAGGRDASERDRLR